MLNKLAKNQYVKIIKSNLENSDIEYGVVLNDENEKYDIMSIGFENKNGIIDDINNEAYFFISRKIKPCKCPHCNTITKHVHDYRDQYIRHSPINGFKTFSPLQFEKLSLIIFKASLCSIEDTKVTRAFLGV